jgi:pyruvate/2-oxoglutarate dehydrogenase complex dihydrolipoamide dehydrogenase (E3) component
MTSESDTDSWDVIVIGGGPPGENAAQYATAGNGLTAVIVEAQLLGGECSFWACMPSKALLRPVELRQLVLDVPGTQAMAAVPLDVAAVLAQRDAIVHNHDDSSQVDWATSVGIDVVRGRGRLDGHRRVVVEAADGSTRTLTARQAVVLGTGTTASVPDVPGLAAALPWISRDVTNLKSVPARVVVIGGGVVACEAASWLNGLGAQVTIVQRGPSLLAGNEPFASDLVSAALRDRGVEIMFDATLESVSRPDVEDTGYGRVRGGEVSVIVDGRTLVADEIVVATGRVPVSADIGLQSVGVRTDEHGFVKVDHHLTVSTSDAPWLYAVGDLNGLALLTHMGKYQARICGAVISARAAGTTLDSEEYRDLADYGVVPQVTFTNPQVASVGLSETQARSRNGLNVGVVEYDLAALAGTAVHGTHYAGRAKLVLDNGTDTILGATFVGPEVGEMLHSATVAIAGRVPLSTLWHAVPSYPTISEVWLRLLETRRSQ